MENASLHPFDVLGVSFDASDEEVRSAYFSQIKAHTPEKDPEGFKRIRQAYDKIKTLESRTTLVLETLPSLPSLEDYLGGTDSSVLGIQDEDLVTVVLSVTDVTKVSFSTDLRKVLMRERSATKALELGGIHEGP